MTYDTYCSNCGHTDQWICSMDDYDKRKKKWKCKNCGTIGTTANSFSKAIPAVLKGNGWTAHGACGSAGGSCHWRDRLDIQLAEGDSLREMNDDKYSKRADDIKRMEDKAGYEG